ncbi:MAG: CvpA family protein [Clostridia bacterium]|nr:CvpA family protein [Clostridia bacterium]
MSILLDIIIVAIIALTIYFAFKNGFVKTAISALSFLLAIAVTAAFASPLADFLKETAVAETVEAATEQAITDALAKDPIGINGLLEGKSEEFNNLLTLAQIDRSELAAWYSSNIANAESGEVMLAKRIAAPMVDIIATLIAIIVLYIGTQVILSIAAFILNKIASLPILRTANKGLGLAVGVVLALFRVCLFCFVMNLLIENALFLGNGFISSLNPESTLLFKFFSNIDIFAFFM